ncbi:MAG: substrate-binding domain-containing protein [Chloroflexota bacterium]
MCSVVFRALSAAALLGSLVTPVAGAQANCVQPTSQQLIIYHAGSVNAAFMAVEQAFTCQTGVQVQDGTGGSVDLLRQVTAGAKPADIVASADYVDVENFLKPAGVASYDIRFARGRMVLAYSASGVGPGGKNLPPIVDPAGPAFSPPNSVPTVVDDWYQTLLGAGVVVGGSHPFLDPSGYRSHLIFQLTQAHYGIPDLSNNLLEHYLARPAAAPANAFSLGKQYDFQFIYEHSAQAVAQSNPDFRYAYLPDDIDMSNSSKNDFYSHAVVKMPGLGVPSSDAFVDVQGSRVVWGLTIMKSALNRENAIKFLQLFLTPGDVGQTTLQKVGPTPITPAAVSSDDYEQLPPELRNLVTTDDPVG